MSRVERLSTPSWPVAAWQDRGVSEAEADRQPADRRAAPPRQELVSEVATQARLHQNAYDRFEDAAAAYLGVNRTAMRCLEVLDREGQRTPGEIAAQTHLSSGAVTAMLDRLERAKLVQRMPDPGDRRRVLVQLTDKARRVATEVYGPIIEAMDEFDRYTDDELRLLGDFLKLATTMQGRQADRVERMRAERDAGAALPEPDARA
jgi:DNA-binding MarR family transcriptional regulator